MKLKTYIKELQKLAKKYPDATVIYAIDDEGNGYNEVYMGPSACVWDGNDIILEEDHDNPNDVNAVILN